jgi:hypothetical protein
MVTTHIAQPSDLGLAAVAVREALSLDTSEGRTSVPGKRSRPAKTNMPTSDGAVRFASPFTDLGRPAGKSLTDDFRAVNRRAVSSSIGTMLVAT